MSGAFRRIGTMTIDQALVGASSIVITIFAARGLPVESFGLFALVQVVYLVTQVAARAVACDPLLVHPEELEERTGEVVGSGIVLGLVLGVLILLAAVPAYLWEEDLGNGLVVLGVCMPGLVLQDLSRYIGFASRRPQLSLVRDATWFALAIASLSILIASDEATLVTLLLAWAGSGALVGFVGVLRFGRGVRVGIGWLRTTWAYSWRYLLAVTSQQSAVLAGTLAVGLVAGAKALGAVRGAQLLYRPFQTLNFAAVAAGTGEVARMLDRRSVRRHVHRTTVLTTVVAAGNAVVLLLLPDPVGRQVLGETWDLAEPLLVPAVVQIMMVGLMSGVRAGLFGLRAPRKTMILDSAGAGLLLVLLVAGAALDGALGAMWGIALGQAPVALAWWVTFTLHLRGTELPDRAAA